ncbi:translocation/assembly module TamB domain-containing protein, partial [Mycoplasma marinum]
DLINKAIKKASPFDGTTDPKTYKFPKKVSVVLSKKVTINVALTPGTIDAKYGTIAWTAIASNAHGSKTQSIIGTLRGFDGPLSTQKKITDAALDKLAKNPKLVSDAIKKAQHIDNKTDPDGHILPKEIIVPVDGVNIKVKITQPNPDQKDTDKGIIKWTGVATGPHTDKKVNLKDQVDGLKTKKDKEKEAIISGAKTIDGDKINDAIKKAIEKQTGKKISELEPKDVTLPGKIQIPIGGGKEIEVQIKPGKKNAGNGSIDWTGTVIVPGQDPKDAKVINDSLDGFKTNKQKLNKAREDALAKLTVKDINDALKKAENFDDSTDPKYYNFNTRLSINIDGVDIDVILTKGAIDSNEGLISWTLKRASVSGISKSRQDLFGDLEGFASLIKQNIARDKEVISSITPKDINEAIKKSNPLINKSGDKKDIVNYVIPPKVIITKKAKDGQDVRVVIDLTPGSKDPKTGEINWTGRPHTEHVQFDNKKDKPIDGKLPGFETDKEKQDKLNQAILNKITTKDINDAIKVARPFTSSDLASKFVLPLKVTVTIDGNPIPVTLVNKSQNDNLGQITWDAKATLGSKSKEFSNVILGGFKTSSQAAKDANEKHILQSITPKMINDEIIRVKHVGKDIKASAFVIPPQVIIQIDGIDVTVALTPGTANDNNGTIPWTSSASIVGSKVAPRTDVIGNLAGFETVQDVRDKKVEKQIATITEKMINDAIKKKHSFDDSTDATKYPFPASVLITIGKEVFTVQLTKGFVHTVEGAIEWTATATDSTTRITRNNLFGTLYGFETSAQIHQKLVDQAIKDVTKQDVIDAIKKAAHVDDHTDASKYPFPTEVVVPKNGINVKVKLTPGSIDNDKGKISWTGTASAKGSKQTKNINGTLDGFESKSDKAKDIADSILNKLTEKDINDAILSSNPFDQNTDPDKWKMPSQVTVELTDDDGIKHDVTIDLTRRGTNDEKGWIQWTSVASTPNATFSRRDIVGTLKGFITGAKKQEKIEENALANLTAEQINNAIRSKHIASGTTQNPAKPLNALVASTFNLPTVLDVISGGVSIHVTITKGVVDDDKGQISWDLVSATVPHYKVPRTKGLSGILTGFSNKNQQIIDRDIKLLNQVTASMINDAIKLKKSYDKVNGDKASNYDFPPFVTFTIPGDSTNTTITAALTKKVVSDVLGEITWSGTVSTANAQRTDKLTSKLDNFQTNAEELTKKANEAVKKVTDDMINKAIKDAQTITDQTDPLNHKLPAEVTIPIDGINVKVKITQPTQDPKDTDKGQIKWTAKVSAPNADPKVNGRDVQGKIDGFKTKKQKDEEAANAALQGVTVQMVNDSIKHDNPFAKTTDPTKWTLPSSVDVVNQGKTITVKLTAGNVDKVHGTISWMGSATTPNATGERKINGDLNGFGIIAPKPDTGITQKQADDALAKLTEKDINDAIKSTKWFDTNDMASNYILPPKVIILKDGIKITVTLSRTSDDDKVGNISWSGSAEVVGKSSAPVSKNGKLSGFSNEIIRQAAKEDKAVMSVSTDDINKAIKAAKPFNHQTDPSTFVLPSKVIITTQDGTKVTVSLTPKGVDKKTGKVKWGAKISSKHGSKTNSKNGDLSGFATQATFDQKAIDNALAKLTEKLINDAIKDISPFDEKIDVNLYPLPNKVKVIIDNKVFEVVLNLVSKDDIVGALKWSIASTTPSGTTNPHLEGTLRGFEVKVPQLEKEAEKAAMNSITAADVNKQIKIDNPFTSSEQAKDYVFPKNIVFSKEGFKFLVALTKGNINNSNGEISWNSSVILEGSSLPAKSVAGNLVGFGTDAQRQIAKEKAALAKLTEKVINDEIKKIVKPSNSKDPSKITNFPKTVTVTIDGVPITVALTKGDVDKQNGGINWTSSATTQHITSPKIDVVGTISGFKKDSKDPSEFNKNILSLLTEKMINDQIKLDNPFTDSDEAKSFAFPKQVIVEIHGVDITVVFDASKGINNDLGNISWSATGSIGKQSRLVLGKLTGFSTANDRIKIAEKNALDKLTDKMINDAIKKVENITKDTNPDTFIMPKKVIIPIDGINIQVKLEKGSVDDVNGIVSWTSSAKTDNLPNPRKDIVGKLDGFQSGQDKIIAHEKDVLANITKDDINKAMKDIFTIDNKIKSGEFAKQFNKGSKLIKFKKDGVEISAIIKFKPDTQNADKGALPWDATLTTPTQKSGRDINDGLLDGFETKALKDQRDSNNALDKLTAKDINNAIALIVPPSSSALPSTIKNFPSKVIVKIDGIDISVKLGNIVKNDDLGIISWTSEASTKNATKTRKDIMDSLDGFKAKTAIGDQTQKLIKLHKDALNDLTEDMINKQILLVNYFDDTYLAIDYALPKKVTVYVRGIPIYVTLSPKSVNSIDGKISWTSHASTDYVQSARNIDGTLSGFKNSSNIPLEERKINEAINKLTAKDINDFLRKTFPFDDKTSVDKWAKNKEDLDLIGKFRGANLRLEFINKAPDQGPDNLKGWWNWKVKVSSTNANVSNSREIESFLKGFDKKIPDDAASNAALKSITSEEIEKAIIAKIPKDIHDPFWKGKNITREKSFFLGNTLKLNEVIIKEWLKYFDGKLNITKNGIDVHVNVKTNPKNFETKIGHLSWKANLWTDKGQDTKNSSGIITGFFNETVSDFDSRNIDISDKLENILHSHEFTMKLINYLSDKRHVPINSGTSAKVWANTMLPSKSSTKVDLENFRINDDFFKVYPEYNELKEIGLFDVNVWANGGKTGSKFTLDGKKYEKVVIDDVLGTARIALGGFGFMIGGLKYGGMSKDVKEKDSKSEFVYLNGFKNNLALFTKASNDAINSVTAQDIKDAIKKVSPFDRTTDPAEWLKWHFPKTITIWKGAKNDIPINVDLTPGSINIKDGEILWGAELSTQYSKIRPTFKNEKLTGFMDFDAINELKEKKIINGLTTDQIEKAIREKTQISGAISPKDALLPQIITIPINGLDIKLKVTKTGFDLRKGQVSWKAIVEPKYPTNTKKEFNGNLNGYKDNISSIIGSITTNEINSQIKIDEPFTQSTNAKDYNMPKKVVLTFMGEKFDVTISKGFVDNSNGNISWNTKIVSQTNSKISISLGGKLSGFINDIMRNKAQNEAAENTITVAMINDAIKKISPISGEAKDYPFPTNVTILNNGVNVLISLTPNVKNSDRKISWQATFNDIKKTLSGDLTGFELYNSQKDIDAITFDMINAAIKAKNPYDNSTKVSEFTLPSSIDVTIPNGKKVTVLLKAKGTNPNIGSVFWEASFKGNHTTKIGQLTGFDSNIAADKRKKITAAIGKITEQDINDAIINRRGFTDHTDPRVYNIPGHNDINKGQVIINKDGFNFTVDLETLSVDGSLGAINWIGTISHKNISITRTTKGSLTGFESDSDKNANILEDLLNSLTESEVNAAILKKNPITDPNDINKFLIPKFVKVNKTARDGTNYIITVILTHSTIDEKNGQILWKANATTTGTTEQRGITGSLGGFANLVDAIKAKTKHALDNLSATEINNKIAEQAPFNKDTDPNLYKNNNFPGKVEIIKDGISIKVTLIPGSIDSSNGSIAWTATASANNQTKANITGSLTGMLDGNSKSNQDEQDALNSLTSSEIIDAIKQNHSFDRTTNPHDYKKHNGTIALTITKHLNGKDYPIHVDVTLGNVSTNGEIKFSAKANTTNITSSISRQGTLLGFETDAEKAQKIARANALAAINTITDLDINNKLKQLAPFDRTINAEYYKNNELHTILNINKNGINFSINLIARSVDQANGSINWDALISDSSTNTSKWLRSKKLSGFQNGADQDILAKKNALSKLTSNDINDAIKSQGNVNGDPNKFNIPQSITIPIDGQNIDIKLRKTSISDAKGEVHWAASASIAGISNTRNINGTLGGFTTSDERKATIANNALNNLTEAMVNAQIRKDNPFTKKDSALTYVLPKQVIVNVNGIDVIVKLKSGNRDNLNGSVSWTGTTSTRGTTRTGAISSSLFGFMDLAGQEQKAIDNAIKNITEAQINTAIWAKSNFDSTTDTNNYNFPTSVVVTSSGINVQVTFSNNTKNRNAGTISWTAVANVKGASIVNAAKNGTLIGFQTQAERDANSAILDDQRLIRTITQQDINQAIIAKHQISTSIDPHSFNIPSTVSVIKGGKTFNVSLINNGINSDRGEISLISAITSPRSNASKTLYGVIGGFKTSSILRNENIERILNNLTPDEISKEMEKQFNLNKNDKPSNSIIHGRLQMQKDGETINIIFNSINKDDTNGRITWNAITSITGSPITKTKQGSIDGFENQDSINKRLVDSKIDSITATMINDLIKQSRPFSGSDLASKFYFPSKIIDNIDGFPINISNIRSIAVDSDGKINWTMEISSPSTTKTRIISGSLRGFMHTSSSVNINDIALSTVGSSEINNAVKTAVPNWASLTAGQMNLPAVTFSHQGHSVSAIFKTTTKNNATGSISWTAEITTNGTTSKRTLSGIFGGLRIPINQNVIQDLNSITASMINNAEKIKNPIGQHTIANYPFSNVSLTNGQSTFDVKIINSSQDSLSNSISWTALVSHVNGQSRIIKGSLTGFANIGGNVNPIDTAIDSLTANQITTEIKRKSPIGNNKASTYRVPRKLVININNVPIQVVINSSDPSDLTSSVNWTATIYAPGSSKVRSLSGAVTGFQTITASNPTDLLIDGVSASEINNAIKAKNPINGVSSGQYILPIDVIVNKNGKKLYVQLMKINNTSNGITWAATISDGSIPITTTHTHILTGALDGFNHSSANISDTEMKKIISEKIVSGSATSINNLLPSSFYNKPLAKIMVDGKLTNVRFTSNIPNDANGSVSWTAEILDNGAPTGKTLQGIIKGFKSTSGNQDALNVISGMTSSQIAKILYEANKANFGRPNLFVKSIGNTIVYFTVSQWDFDTITQDTTWTVKLNSGGHERTVSGKLSERSNASPASPMPQAYSAQVEQRSFFANDLTDIYSI